MRVFVGLFTVILFGIPAVGHALRPDREFHDYLRDNWSTQQGLPQVTVTAIAQDDDGYLWIGTTGLARFDGVRMVPYSANDTPGLPNNRIQVLQKARDGKLWIGTTEGIAVYDNGTFKPIPASDAGGELLLEANDFVEDATGHMWVTTTQGMFEAVDGKLQAVPGSPKPAQAVLADAKGFVVGSFGVVHYFVAGKWREETLPGTTAARVNRLVRTQGRLWAATSMGLFFRDAKGWKRFFDENSPLARAPIDLLYADRDDNLWVGGGIGLARIRERALVELVKPADPGGITGLTTAFEDREGNLWLGSLFAGLTRVSNSWARSFNAPGSLGDRIVWSIALEPDQHRLWVGRNDGVSLFSDGKYKSIVPSSALPHPQAYNLLAERDRLWIGTRQGVAIVDHVGPQAGQVQHPAWLAPLATAQIQGFVRTPDGDLWIPTTEGLYRIQDDGLRHYGKAEGLFDPRLRYLQRLRDGRILAATQGGLFELHDDRFVPFDIDSGLPPNTDITALVELSDGGIVAGTFLDRSFVLYDKHWHQLGAAEGLPDNTAFFMAEYAGFLWISGIHGIERVPIADIAAYASGSRANVRGEMLIKAEGNAKGGQPGACCNGAGNSKGLLWGDTLWLPAREGIVRLGTKDIVKNPVPPNVVIERVQAGDKWLPTNELHNGKLPRLTRDLLFEYTVLSLQDPKLVGIQYRLVGYDRDWQEGNALQRNVRYTNLPPGEYSFEVRGTNNDGVPSKKAAQLVFSIEPYFHETKLFKFLMSLLVLTAIYGLYRFQKHFYQRQKQMLEALVAQRTEALSAANQKLEEFSYTDPLTGLRNRRYLNEQIPSDLPYYDRRNGTDPGADVLLFVMVDIDHFKVVNDQHGHAAGDLVLQQFSKVLESLVRSGDYVVRWGGEEFLLVFRPMPTRNLSVIGDRLRHAVVTHEFDIGTGTPLQITCSVGISEYPLFFDPQIEITWEMMVNLADHALYYVKSHGRDGWAAFRPTEKTDISALMENLRNGADKLLIAGQLQLIGTKAGPA